VFKREYRWQKKDMGELISDLSSRFLSAWRKTHDRSEVERYPFYFLGSIIISNKNGRLSVIDGQQRLTSLSILLIWLRRGLLDGPDRTAIDNLIASSKFGKFSYNLEV
jgi:uncharacterized protein with ParB-like and HNH nuclease domain